MTPYRQYFSHIIYIKKKKRIWIQIYLVTIIIFIDNKNAIIYYFPYFNLSLQMVIAICDDVISTTLFRSKWIVAKIKLFLSLWIIFFFPFCNIRSDKKYLSLQILIYALCGVITSTMISRMNHLVKINIFFLFPTQIIDGVPNDGYWKQLGCRFSLQEKNPVVYLI